MSKLCFLLSAMLLMLHSSVFAEETRQPALSLQECAQIALQNNSDVLIGQYGVVSAKSQLINAKSDYFPQVSVQNTAFSWGSGGVLSQSTTGTALNVSQNIYDGGLREVNTQGAKYNVAQSMYGLTRTQQTVLFNVSKAYYEVLRGRHLAEVAKANVIYNEGLRDQIQARAKEGEAAKVDVLPVEAQLASAQMTLLSAQNVARTSIIKLQNIIGLSSQSGFDIKEVDSRPDIKIDQLENYLSLALKSRPDILQYKSAAGSARASVKSKRIALYPRPVITADYQVGLSGGYRSSGSQIVGGIAFDLFNGGANQASYREAKANLGSVEVQEKQILRDVHSDIEEAYLNLINAQQRITASNINLDAADKNYQAQKERYTQGLGTTLDLLNAEVQMVTAQSDDVQARYDYYIAISQMQYASGTRGGLL